MRRGFAVKVLGEGGLPAHDARRRQSGPHLRVAWDILHHHRNDRDGIPDREAREAAPATWPAGVVPEIHLSSPNTAMEERRKRVGRRVERTWVLLRLRAQLAGRGLQTAPAWRGRHPRG